MKRDTKIFLLIVVLLLAASLIPRDPLTGQSRIWPGLVWPVKQPDPPQSSRPQPQPPTFDEWWSVPPKPTPEAAATAAYWENIYLRALIDTFPEHYVRSSTDVDAESLHRLIAMYAARSEGYRWAPFSTHLGGHTVHLQRDVYLRLITCFTGRDDPGYIDTRIPNYIGETGRTVMLPPDRNTFDWDHQQRRILDITLQDESADRVTLVVGFWRYGTAEDDDDPHYRIAYTMLWEDTVGYVPESIVWLWPELPETGVLGDVHLFDTLWGRTADGEVNPPFHDSRYRFYTVGSTTYDFSIEDNALIANTFDMQTGEMHEAILLFEAASPIETFRPSETGIVIRDEANIHRIDYAGGLLAERIWPLDWPEEWQHRVVSDDLRHCAFVTEEGVFLIDLDGDSEPILLTEQHPDYDHENIVERKNYYPVRFMGEDRLLLGIQAFEWTDGYVLVDLKGRIIDELDIFVSGPLAGGYFHGNNASAVYFAPGYSDEQRHMAFDFTTGMHHTLTELENFQFEILQQCLSPLDDPHRWYVNSLNYVKGRYDIVLGSNFYRIDAAAGQVETLPFEVAGAATKILAADRDGRVLFAYSDRETQGFGLYVPEDIAEAP